MNIVPERLLIPKGKSFYKKSSSFATYLQGVLFSGFAFLGRSFHENRPPPCCFLVGPSPIHCTAQRPAMGRGNRPRKHRFPRKFRPQIWTLLFSNAKKNGWNGDSAARGRGASFELSVDWGLGNPSYTWEIRVYSRVFSFTKTSSGIKLWKHHVEHAFCGVWRTQVWIRSIYHICQVYIYPFTIQMCSLLDLVNPPEDPLDPVEDCSEEEVRSLPWSVVHKWNIQSCPKPMVPVEFGALDA